jgi:hypothetical protein
MLGRELIASGPARIQGVAGNGLPFELGQHIKVFTDVVRASGIPFVSLDTIRAMSIRLNPEPTK